MRKRTGFGVWNTIGALPIIGCLSLSVATPATTQAQTATAGTISTIAGTGTTGYNGDGGPGTSATVYYPTGTAVDSAGNVYVADYYNHRIRKIAVGTGIITTVAGTGTAGYLGDGGNGTAARLYYPTDVAVNAAGDLFIADSYNHRLRKVTAATGIITTIAGTGTAAFGGDGAVATTAQLYYPYGVSVDGAGNIYIADEYNHRVRKVVAGTNIISTIAGTGTAGYNGDGTAVSSNLYYPTSVDADPFGNVYVADYYNHRIRKITQASGSISTVAGTGAAGYSGDGGLATAAKLYYPLGVAVDAAGNVFIADTSNDRVRKLTIATGIITTEAGSGNAMFGGDGGLGPAGQIYRPSGVAVDAAGNLYIGDHYNHRVRKVSTPAATHTMSTMAGTGTYGYNGDGTATSVQLAYPYSTALDTAGNVYIADTYSHRIRKVTQAGVLSTIAGTGVAGYLGENSAATSARLYYPQGLAIDAANNLYVADSYNHRIRKITPAGIITTVAGSGTAGFSGEGVLATTALLNYPTAVAVDGSGNLYIADQYNHRIRKVTAATGNISTAAGTGTLGVGGDGGLATAAQLNYPQGVAVDGSGNIYVSDTSNHRIRRVTAASGVISTYAGTGVAGFLGENGPATAARLHYPRGLNVDVFGNLYVADSSNNRIRKIATATGAITTVAGSSSSAYGGDGGAATAAGINAPFGVAIDNGGNMYIADSSNNRVRRAAVPIVAPTNLTLTRYGVNGIILNWAATSGATSYNIKSGTTSGGEAFLVNVGTNSAFLTVGLGTRYFFLVSARYGSTESGNSNEASIVLTPAAARSDVDGDMRSDIMLYRPSAGYWYSRNSGSGYAIGAGNWVFQWGAPGDVPIQGDFDGDGKLDPTVFRPSTAQWFIRYSTKGYDPAQFGYFEWGASGDTPVSGDWDGDGRTDFGVYRGSNGYWYLRLSGQNYVAGAGNWIYQWGAPGDTPKLGDFDADGRTDLAIYRAGNWFIRYSSLGFDPNLYAYYAWGAGGDTPIVGDFDGDGRTDIGVYRGTAGYWYLRLSSQNYTVGAGNWQFQWGAPGDEPKLGDFDGDGKLDITVYRPTAGTWFILYSSQSWNPATYGYYEWGAGGDLALPQN